MFTFGFIWIYMLVFVPSPGEVEGHLGHRHVFHNQQQASSFLANTFSREARSNHLCDDEGYCEANKPTCFIESARETQCEKVTCPSGSTCYMSIPCPAHYRTTCTEDLCSAEPCKNGGTCLNGYNSGFACLCVTGSSGETCESDAHDDCDPNPCQNGGTCTDQVLNYQCTCLPGYEGTQCETDIDECASDPCQHGGTCVDLVNGYYCQCEEDYTGHQCETDMCLPIHDGGGIDVIFAIDTSLSLDFSNWDAQKQYIKDFIAEFPIGSDGTLVGCMSYSYSVTTHFHLNENTNNGTLNAAVDSLSIEGGTSSYLGKALQYIRETMLTTGNGMRPSTAKYVILMTDGLSSNPTDTLLQAELLRQNGVYLFVVCYGHTINFAELISITSEHSYVFPQSNQDGIHVILKRNVMEECPDCSRRYSDVAVAMEMSANVEDAEYFGRLAALNTLLDSTPVSPDGIRVSYTLYGQDVTPIFGFDTYSSKSFVIPAIQDNQVELVGSSNFTKLLEYFQQDGFSSTLGARTGYRQILILFTNGHFTDPDTVFQKAATLREANVNLVTVSVSANVNLTSLGSITADPSYNFVVGDAVNINSDVLMTLRAIMQYDVCQFD